MKFSQFEHCSGYEIVKKFVNLEDIENSISDVNVKLGKGAVSEIRSDLTRNLIMQGWTGEVKINLDSSMTITSIKNDIGLCVQTGNMSRIYADLIKLQTLYLNSAIQGAILIIPSQELAKILGSNLVNAKRLEKELAIFEKAYNVPTLIYVLTI